MKNLLVPVVKIERKEIAFNFNKLSKIFIIISLALLFLSLLFCGFYISGVCLIIISVIAIRGVQFYQELNSIDWSSDQYEFPLENIIRDLEQS